MLALRVFFTAVRVFRPYAMIAISARNNITPHEAARTTNRLSVFTKRGAGSRPWAGTFSPGNRRCGSAPHDFGRSGSDHVARNGGRLIESRSPVAESGDDFL